VLSGLTTDYQQVEAHSCCLDCLSQLVRLFHQLGQQEQRDVYLKQYAELEAIYMHGQTSDDVDTTVTEIEQIVWDLGQRFSMAANA